MTDFVDVLERQLREAHGRRPRLAPPWRAGIALAATATAAAAIVVLVLSLASPSSEHAARPQPPAGTVPAAGLDASVAVLNGTTVAGLARAAADELVANGYPEPVVVTNDTTNQTRQRTAIFFEPGHEADAQGVAGCLRVGFERIRPMTPAARVLADRADVAVFLGADKAR